MTNDLLLTDDAPQQTVLGILQKEGADWVFSFVPTDDVLWVEKWKHTLFFLFIFFMVVCFFALMGLWERMSRMRWAIVIILLFIFAFTIQTFLFR